MQRRRPSSLVDVSSTPATQPTLESLLARIAAGERAAFDEVYNRIVDVVYGLARRVVVDTDIAADVAQDVLVAVWNKAARFDATRGSAMAWIATMTRSRAIDVVRSLEASRRREANQDPAPEPNDPVAESVVIRAEHSQVHNAVLDLTDLQRESIELAFYEGLTHTQISDRLDIPLGTVKTRIRDGLLCLSAQLEELFNE